MKERGIIGRSSIAQELVGQLRTDIILRRYNTGDKLREVELAERYGVSRTIVRSVFLQLEHEGLIRTNANGTRSVMALELQDIQNLYELRNYLERTAVRQLMSCGERNLLPVMEIMQKVVGDDGSSLDDTLDIDSAFHRAVIEASRNKALLQAWDTISGVMSAVFRLNMTESQEYQSWFKETFRERHVALFVALMGDADEAGRLYEEHIGDALEISRKAIEKIEAESRG